jgi:lysophospholipase L1-like esterase
MHVSPPLMARIAFAAAALVFAAITLASSAALAQARMPTHVACVGDSITYGYLASSSSKSYPSDLQTMFGNGVKVMNFGRNSATLLSVGDLPYINQTEYTAATTFVANAGANAAVVDVIIMLGTNDSKSYNWAPSAGSTRAQQFMTDLAAMVDHFTGLATHPVVFLAVPPAIFTNSFGISEAVTNNEIAPIIRQVAMQKGTPIIDVHAATASRADLFSDGVHPTDAGYLFLAQVMHDGLLRVPSISITAPTSGASIAGTTVGISANASGGTVPITSVQFLAGTSAIATVAQSPFTTMWMNVAPGPYSLTAKATDKTGAATTSSAVTITVSGGSGAGGAAGGAGASGAGGAGRGGAGADGGSSGNGASGGRGGSTGGGSGTSGAAGRGGAGGSSSGVAGTGGGTGGLGTGGASGAAGMNGGAGTGGAGTGGGTGGATTADAGRDAPAAGDDGGGCGCRLGGQRSGSGLALVLAVIAFGLRRSRRR